MSPPPPGAPGARDPGPVVAAAIARHRMIRAGDRVLAAVSGGGDSILLLRLLADLRAVIPFTLLVAHLNHGLRGAESDADEAFVRGRAAGLGLPFHAGRADLQRRAGEPSSLEERARDARRAFLLATAREAGCGRIALGHTLDDQVETILMWLLRGSGRAGLSGMEPVTGEGFVRPLLGLRRAEVRAWLERLGEPWREDATNEGTDRLRTRIRHRLVPLLDAEFAGSVETIAGCAPLLADEEAYLDEEAAARLGPPAAEIPANLIASAPPALARRMARRAASFAGVEPRSLGRVHLEALVALAGEADGRGVDLPGGVRAERVGGSLRFRLPGRPGGEGR